MDADKKKALDMAMHQIEKDFGKGSIMKLGEASAKMNIEVIPTGALSLDIALGVGGIPRGRVIEIYGPESSGKTTVALHMIAEAQKLGGYAAFKYISVIISIIADIISHKFGSALNEREISLYHNFIAPGAVQKLSKIDDMGLLPDKE